MNQNKNALFNENFFIKILWNRKTISFAQGIFFEMCNLEGFQPYRIKSHANSAFTYIQTPLTKQCVNGGTVDQAFASTVDWALSFCESKLWIIHMCGMLDRMCVYVILWFKCPLSCEFTYVNEEPKLRYTKKSDKLISGMNEDQYDDELMFENWLNSRFKINKFATSCFENKHIFVMARIFFKRNVKSIRIRICRISE